MRYISNSPSERRSMLQEIGCESIEDLFDQIPEKLRLSDPLGIGSPVSEPELLESFRDLASKNGTDYLSFLGAGAYSHFIPVIIDTLISRSEFFTSYTPYQPELSQGTLQAVFEFQTMICQLTGMEVGNASMYDGSTALAEAVLMADRITGRNRIVIADSVHPQYREVARSYTANLDLKIEYAPHSEEGIVEPDSLRIDKDTAAVIVQSPNFFGCIEHISSLAEKAHSEGALLITAVAEPLSLGVLRPPGECGADIVVGEGQSFGIPLGFGGPYLGLFASREKYVRQMPGRLVGEAADSRGRRGFVLTLSTREQHIRREKATSNICTNQGLCALMATIYLATLGRRGLQEVAKHNIEKARYAADEISKLEGFSLRFAAPFFNEFVVRTPRPAIEVTRRLMADRIIGGVALECYYPDYRDSLLVCVTETAKREEIDRLIAAMRKI
ncbi:MAG TPA: aminomethyl-transferring glycine dehydrogenase subunit GcvPA [Blastocatellia bacterium]|nr:aminomethyl-transferring glycine dehydrogenase subunit GcvPA [Blastocatellia bacterium]